MNVLDSSAWLEILVDGPNASSFMPVLEQEEALIVPSLCYYEVFRKLIVTLDDARAMDEMGALDRGFVAELDADIAIAAALLSKQHKLPMADSIMLATARAYGATFWTQDAHFADIDGVKYFPKGG